MKMGGGIIVGVVVVALAAMSMTMDVAAAAAVNHVVGGDHGWDPTSDILYWSSNKIFRVGDRIWLTYSAAQGLIAELKSREEYESCNLSNAIMMYTEGLHTIPLEKEGMRYFVSTDSHNCKNGLKLHVQVQPKDSGSRALHVAQTVVADGPASPPSGSARYGYNVILSVLLCVVVVLAY